MAKQQSSIDAQSLTFYLGKGYNLLSALGFDTIPTDRNPVWQALASLSPIAEEDIIAMVETGDITEEEARSFRDAQGQGDELVELLKPFIWRGGKPNKRLILTTYVLIQTACLNELAGPIGTGDLGTIRQRWYASKSSAAMGFKFASQCLERYLIKDADVVLVGDKRERERAVRQGARRVELKALWDRSSAKQLKDELGRTPKVHTWPKQQWGRVYAQLHSQILTGLVRAGLTYEELWVSDASRKTVKNTPLLEGFYACFLLEKEGLLPHFTNICKAAGIPVLVAMSGNNAFSAVEFILTENFRKWGGELMPTVDNPLHLFTLTDHDYAGHIPVEAGAVSQFERYLPGAVELHRVGVMPEQIKEAGRSILQTGYEFEHDYNSAYQQWADNEGIWIGDTCYGIEVEALVPNQYIDALIDAIIEALGGDEELRKKLAERAEPDWYDVQRKIARDMYEMSELIQRLVTLGQWAEDCRLDVERPIDNWVDQEIDPDRGWAASERVKRVLSEIVRDQNENLDFDEFKSHVATDQRSTWNPIGAQAANDAAAELFGRDRGLGAIGTALQVDVDDEGLLDALREVFYTLSYHNLEFED
ncbi:MAG: hypothetical protein KAT00_01390 [Planctomycetes bacterium]|nr:hypothetical protein [Planctomycetota bacterium]